MSAAWKNCRRASLCRDSRGGCLHIFILGHHIHLRSSAEQGTGEAGGAAAAVDAEFAAGEGADVESGLAEAGVGFVIFFDGEQTIVSESEDVAGQSVALGGIDFDEFESARLQQFDSFHGEPGEIDEGGVVVEQADQGHQMQAGGGSGAVGQRR